MKLTNNSKGFWGNKLVIFGIVLIVVFGIILGYLSADLYTKLNDNTKSSDNSEVLNISETSFNDPILNEGAMIVYKRMYIKCNEVMTEQETADSQYTGKNEEELKEVFKDWRITSFNNKEIVLQKDIDSYSPNYYKLGIYNDGENEDMVAVFTFNADGEEVVMSVTETPASLLHEDDIKRLQDGIYTNDEDDMYNMLQNFDE